jgi:hypothetical protein
MGGGATGSLPNPPQQREGKKVIPEVSKNTVPPNVENASMIIDIPESSKGVKKTRASLSVSVASLRVILFMSVLQFVM